jgi:hypothetical protein
MKIIRAPYQVRDKLQREFRRNSRYWIPVFTGMTNLFDGTMLYCIGVIYKGIILVVRGISPFLIYGFNIHLFLIFGKVRSLEVPEARRIRVINRPLRHSELVSESKTQTLK